MEWRGRKLGVKVEWSGLVPLSQGCFDSGLAIGGNWAVVNITKVNYDPEKERRSCCQLNQCLARCRDKAIVHSVWIPFHEPRCKDSWLLLDWYRMSDERLLIMEHALLFFIGAIGDSGYNRQQPALRSAGSIWAIAEWTLTSVRTYDNSSILVSCDSLVILTTTTYFLCRDSRHLVRMSVRELEESQKMLCKFNLFEIESHSRG